ncbi:MAG: glycosyltransferase [Planctomycetota bacterium]
MTLLQVGNVGDVTGGTGACVRTVTRALPDFAHVVAFPGRPSDETRAAFAGCRWVPRRRVDAEFVSECGADVVLLHNVSRDLVDKGLPALTLAYTHSRVTPPLADGAACCSRWLADQCGSAAGRVLTQAVPVPPRPAGCGTRSLGDGLTVGRICTPRKAKWPDEIVPLYSEWAERFPAVRWAFVGCPGGLVEPLREACGGRAEFVAASHAARGELWKWDVLLYHHPTLTESFGRTCAEAMRAGCIPVVDARGGFVEQIDGRPGGGILASDAGDFAAAIDALLDPGERLRRSRRVRAIGDERFSISRFRRDLLAWFGETLAAVRAQAA